MMSSVMLSAHKKCCQQNIVYMYMLLLYWTSLIKIYVADDIDLDLLSLGPKETASQRSTAEEQAGSLTSPFPFWVPRQAYVLNSSRLPENQRLWPEIGNGHLATVVYSDTIHMNGFYNGKTNQSHRARIQSMTSVRLKVDLPSVQCSQDYALHLDEGSFIESTNCNNMSLTLSVRHRIYAHRTITELLVNEIVITKTRSQGTVDVTLDWQPGPPSQDLDTEVCPSSQHYPRSPLCQHSSTKQRETDYSTKTEIYMYYDQVPSILKVESHVTQMTWVGLLSLHPNADRASQAYNEGRSLAESGSLYNLHVQAWYELWRSGRIDLLTRGQLEVPRLVYSGLYYLLSSIPLLNDAEWPFVGMSPGGLAHGGSEDFWGHVFWDQDTWMFPSILMFHPDLANTLLSSRKRIHQVAKMAAYKAGYSGAKFPWEAAFSGEEVSPSEDCANYEIHISGDIALATQQYYHMTKKHDFVNISLDIADFWVSRLIYDSQTGLQYINEVMGPDEYHFPVNNSAYTNAIAKNSIEFAQQLSKDIPGLRHSHSQSYSHYHQSIWIPYDPELNFNPEFTGYRLGTKVKQADTVMIQYPLMMVHPKSIAQNNLNFYQSNISAKGPAMTWSIFAINWLELNNQVKADIAFRRSYANAHGPFLVWTENADQSGAVNFHTAIGGFLQSLIFGYGGFRIKLNWLEFNPSLLADTLLINFIGINYQNATLDYQVTKSQLLVKLTAVESSKITVYLEDSNQKRLTLKVGDRIVLKRQKVLISTELHQQM